MNIRKTNTCNTTIAIQRFPIKEIVGSTIYLSNTKKNDIYIISKMALIM